MAFSATEAALEGFKITRGRPGAALAWGLFQIVPILLQKLAYAALVGPRMNAFLSLNPLAPMPSAEMMRMATVMFEFFAVFILIWVLANGVLYAAVNRSIQRPNEGGPGWLGLGADEARQVAVLFCYALALLAVYFGGLMAVQLAALLMGLVLGVAGALVVVFLGFPAVVCAVVYVGVRLSLAPAATFDRGRFVLFDTWALTKGRVFPMFGAYFIAWAMSLLVTVLVACIGLAVARLAPGADASGTLTLGSLLTARFAIETVFDAAAAGLTTAVAMAPAVFIYREISGPGAALRVVA